MFDYLVLIDFHSNCHYLILKHFGPLLYDYLIIGLSLTRAIPLDATSLIILIINFRFKVFYLPYLNKGYKVFNDPCLKSNYTKINVSYCLSRSILINYLILLAIYSSE